MRPIAALSLFFILINSVHPKQPYLLVSAPYIPEGFEWENKGGREYETLEAIFKCMGHTFKTVLHPFGRHIKSFVEKKHAHNDFDVVATVYEEHKGLQYYSEPYIAYHNGIIYQTKRMPEVKSIKDFYGKHVVGFVNSENIVDGLKGHTAKFASYIESSNQISHNHMLLRGRVDGVVSDGLVFMAHQRNFLKEKPQFKNIPIKFFSLNSIDTFKAGFKKEALRDQFNKCLKDPSVISQLNAINRKYLTPYMETLGESYLSPLIRIEGKAYPPN